MKTIKVTVVSNQEVAPACFHMVLGGPLEDFHLKPGQFIMLRVGESSDPLLRRPFAALRFKTSAGIFLEIFYQVLGHGTHLMSRLFPPAELELFGPLGNGFTIPDNLSSVLIVAGGMGIVPLRALIHCLVGLNIQSLNVFAGAKSASLLLFQPEFQKMGVGLHLATEDGSTGHHGLVTEVFGQFLENNPQKADKQKICFSCGPRLMLKEVVRLSAHYQVSCQVSLESRMACGIGVCLGCAVKMRKSTVSHENQELYGRVCLEGPVFDAEVLAW